MLKRPLPKSSNINDRPSKRADTQPSSWKAAFEMGRTAFAEARYQDAIAEFTRAIEHNQNITLYDCRAAAYEKLGQYAKGLEDAMAMMRLAPEQSKGYLRAGKLLVLQERFSKAVAVYQRALRSVSKSDTRYGMLETMQQRTKASMTVHNKQHDFTKVLPYDILSSIFSLVSFDRRIQCMAVCRSWRGFLQSWSGMWCDLHLTGAMSAHAIKQYMGYTTGRYVRRFGMTGHKRSRMNTILQLLIDRDCHYIESLEVVDCDLPALLFLRVLRLMGKELRSLKLIDTGLPLKIVVEQALTTCPGVTQLIYHDAHMAEQIRLERPLGLTHLSLSGPSTDIQRLIIQHSPHLRRIAIYPSQSANILSVTMQHCPCLVEFSYAKRAEYWTDDDTSSISTPQAVGLQHLAFPNPSMATEESLVGAIQTSHEMLQVLDIRGCDRWTGRAAERLASLPLARLRQVYIQSTAAFTESQLCGLIRNAAGLEIVHMQSMPSVTNAVLEALAEQQSLRWIDISNCPQVTGLGIRRLLQGKHMIQRLVMNNCTNIRTDAAALAREKLGRNAVEMKFT